MITFKQFLTEVMDMQLLTKLINNLAKQMKPKRPYIFCEYDGALHEGFIEDARVNNDFSMIIDYKTWREDEGTFVPAMLCIYEEDVDLFYFGEYDGRKALMCKHPSERTDEAREIYAKKITDAPEWAPQHAEDHYRIGDITFSARDGLGSVPINANIWYEGFVVLMTPSTFLDLAISDDGHQEPTSHEIEKLAKEGYAVGVPFLDIRFDPDGKALPQIVGHEGRGRMRMIKRVLGDQPVPVHMKLRDGLRSRDVTPEMLDEVKLGLMAQGTKRVVRRPVKKVWLNGKEV